MGNVVGPSSSRGDEQGGKSLGYRIGEFASPFIHAVRRYGARGMMVLVVAAAVAFAPLAALYWFNEMRLANVASVAFTKNVVALSARSHDEQEKDGPGETALLKVTCELTAPGEPRPVMTEEESPQDRARAAASGRREMAYVRPKGVSQSLPFALLGMPPVSAWLPAGEYEIMVVHSGPRSEQRVDAPSNNFPLVSVFAECKLENKSTTTCRVPLPHHEGAFGTPLEIASADGLASDRPPSADELAALLVACESLAGVPTPAGYVLALDEPMVHHEDGHQHCTVDFASADAVPREWTRGQLVTLRNWLPADATAARGRLSSLINRLGWRQFLQGWFCYAAAGVTGLVFTRWGAIALLEPWRRGDSFRESLWLLVKLFLLSILAMIAFQFLTDGQGCSGPLVIRR
jgi:hypothetical protein